MEKVISGHQWSSVDISCLELTFELGRQLKLPVREDVEHNSSDNSSSVAGAIVSLSRRRRCHW